MARFGYTFSGGAPVMKRFKLGISATPAGIPIIDGATTNPGVLLCSATAAANVVGLSTDTGVYSTVQGATEGMVTVIVNPDLVAKWKLANGATSGTQMIRTTNSSASAGGTVVTITAGDAAPNGPEMIDGTAVCISGNNAGLYRAITSSGATSATVTVPFPNAIAVGDVFVLISQPSHSNSRGNKLNLTTLLNEVRHDIAVGTGIAARTVELAIDFSGLLPALRNSYALALFDDHVYKDAT